MADLSKTLEHKQCCLSFKLEGGGFRTCICAYKNTPHVDCCVKSAGVDNHVVLISKDLSCQNDWVSIIAVRFTRLLGETQCRRRYAPPRIAVYSELVRVAHWVEGGQYFQIADREVPPPCEIILGTCVMAWDRMLGAGGMMMCTVEISAGASSPKQGRKKQHADDKKTKRARMQEEAENDLEWGSVVGRKFLRFLQQCQSPEPHCLLTSSLRDKVRF